MASWSAALCCAVAQEDSKDAGCQTRCWSGVEQWFGEYISHTRIAFRRICTGPHTCPYTDSETNGGPENHQQEGAVHVVVYYIVNAPNNNRCCRGLYSTFGRPGSWIFIDLQLSRKKEKRLEFYLNVQRGARYSSWARYLNFSLLWMIPIGAKYADIAEERKCKRPKRRAAFCSEQTACAFMYIRAKGFKDPSADPCVMTPTMIYEIVLNKMSKKKLSHVELTEGVKEFIASSTGTAQ